MPTKTAALVLAAALALTGCATGSGDPEAGASTPTASATSATGPSAVSARWQGQPVTTAEMSAADAKALDEATAKALAAETDGATAYIVGVWDPQKGWHIAAAGTTGKDGQPITADNHMYIGSVTKTATAAAVLQLVDQGKLSLDDTIAEVLPDLAKEFPDIAPVTVRSLLDMSSGIPDYINVEEGGILPGYLKDPSRGYTSAQLIQTALAANPVAPQGTAGYSNTNYIILGELLATITGKTPAQAVNDTLGQLGLTQTTLNPDPVAPLPEPGSQGYYGAEEGQNAKELGFDYGATTDVTGWNKSWAGTAGGISTTAADLAKFAGTGFGTSLLSEPLAQARLTGATMGDFSLVVGLYGLGIGVRGDWVGHEGQLIGWEANSWYNTKSGAAVVVLTNSSGSMDNAMTALTAYYPELATYWNPDPSALASARNLPGGSATPTS